jgi:hypothetical protein
VNAHIKVREFGKDKALYNQQTTIIYYQKKNTLYTLSKHKSGNGQKTQSGLDRATPSEAKWSVVTVVGR